MEECAAGIGVPIAVIFLLVGLVFGFLLGARARQLAAKLKEVGRAMMSLTAVFKIKDSSAMQDAEAMQEGEQENEEEANNKDAEEEKDPMADFLNLDEDAGLDDHPEIELNPVMMFQIKKAKDAQRIQKQREELAAEGLTEAEIDDRIADGATGGAGDGKPNALQVLIAAGARVEPVKGKTSEDAIKKTELRRKQRNIAVFLQKTLDIDTTVRSDKGGAKGGKKSAFEVARETKTKPVGGDTLQRELKQHAYAKAARELLREHKKVIDAEMARRKKKELQTESGLDGGALQAGEHRGNIVGMDASDLAALLMAEEGGEEGADEGEEGFDELEGEDEDDGMGA